MSSNKDFGPFLLNLEKNYSEDPTQLDPTWPKFGPLGPNLTQKLGLFGRILYQTLILINLSQNWFWFLRAQPDPT